MSRNYKLHNKVKQSHQALASNPVEEGLVYYPHHYVYGSARDYTGEKGLINDVAVVS